MTKTKFICVMDYRTCEVRFYNVEVDVKDFDSFDAESWLNENTNYNSDCYYMVCDKAINISIANQKFNSGLKYTHRAPAQDEDKTRHISNNVKVFASEVRKTIEDTYQSFGGSERFDFCDHGLALIESVQNKLDEVLK